MCIVIRRLKVMCVYCVSSYCFILSVSGRFSKEFRVPLIIACAAGVFFFFFFLRKRTQRYIDRGRRHESNWRTKGGGADKVFFSHLPLFLSNFVPSTSPLESFC